MRNRVIITTNEVNLQDYKSHNSEKSHIAKHDAIITTNELNLQDIWS